jgi:signal recognition particle GTPase
VQEVNQLVTQFNQMKKMMKVAGKPGALGKLPFGPRFPG